MPKYKLSLMMLSATMLPAASSYALDSSHYASQSVLASGKWAKVRVNETGMTLITDAQLRTLGFNDPRKVRVYGTGGRQLPYGFVSEDTDDLPLLPSVRTQKGIVFFATDQVTWTRRSSSSVTPYTHMMHEYNDEVYYFLSDKDANESSMAAVGVAGAPGTIVKEFRQRLLHESELAMAADFGSQVWGEDFRSKKSQVFSFQLPGAVDDAATVSVRFGAKTVNGTSSIILSANGSQLPSASADKIGASDANALGKVIQTNKSVRGLDGKLDLGIEFSYSGVLYKARLDYIEVFYLRRLALDKGELYFYLNTKTSEGIEVSGCSPSTRIWDVTDPARPAEVRFSLNGDKASFSVTSGGYREYVAFDAENVTRGVTPAGDLPNQNLHGLDTPDMVIITHPEYKEAADKIASLHRKHDGMLVHVVDAADIYNEFSGGNREPGAFRRLLKMWHDRGKAAGGRTVKYALLMGKALNDNKLVNSENKNLSFKPMPIWESFDGEKEEASFCNDSWLGMLDDVESTRFSMSKAKMHVAVGRIPCTSAANAMAVADKIERYITEPQSGSWRNKVMIIADDGDRGEHLRQAEKVYDAMRASGDGDGANRLYDRIYTDSYSRVMTAAGVTYPQATSRMLNNYNDGVVLTNYIGHASAKGWSHEHLWEWPDITSMSNKKLTFIYGSTCSFADIDKKEECGAESLLLNPDGGAIGLISATRSVYINDNGILNTATMSGLFNRSEDGGTLRWGDVYVNGQNCLSDSNSLRYIFLGDPAVRIPGGSGKVQITSIDGMSSDAGKAPELEAMTSVTVEGNIVSPGGQLASDFDGFVELQLYDGERVVTTNGYDDGAVMTYNDRDKRLSVASAEVKGGKWKATLRVPPEIQNLYTPAMISSYAWSNKGEEANGSFDRLYVYGFNQETPDTSGPDIELFYVNSPNLGQNAVVPSDMMVFARMRDESGINVSQTGIGHSLTLCLDGKDYIDGLSSHYTPDPSDPNLGTLLFPLNGVTPGHHTLTLTVWDNANNFSKADLSINVGASIQPVILDMTASHNAATSSVDFLISTDRPNSQMNCKVTIHDLNGRVIRELQHSQVSDIESMLSATWDLCDEGGNRVPRGIYIYRATIETPDGMYASKSKKLAVSALESAQ